jgi:long-chain acyl-CoA synthetase
MPMLDLLHSWGLGDVLRSHRRACPTRAATIDGAVRYTYPELDDRVNRLATAFDRAGLQPSDRILWLGQNSHRVLELLLACAKRGLVLCPANWRIAAPEMIGIVRDFAPRIVFWQAEEIGAMAAGVRERTGDVPALWLQHDGTGPDSYEAFLKSCSPEDDERPIDDALPVLAIYTAAFDGVPRAALLSQKAILLQGLVMAYAHAIDERTIFLNSGPMFHIGVFMQTVPTFLFGGTNVFVRRVDAREICEVVTAARCTGAFLTGLTQSEMIAANADGRYDLRSLTTPHGSPEWNAMITPVETPLGRHPKGYGQTEVSGVVTLCAFAQTPLGTHGKPSPIAQVRILDDDGRELAPGEIGEIAVRGPTVMQGYLGHDEENVDAITAGFRRTNDLGRREADGSVTFIGPKARMIKSGVENIYPAEVESCLRRHPAVADCAVIGVPDAVWIQSVKALVVLRESASCGAEELIEHCRRMLGSYKKPRHIAFLDTLPRRGVLIDYSALDAAHGGGGYPGAATRSR